MSLRTMDFFGLPVTFRVEMRKNTAAIILSLRSRDKERIDGNGAIVYELSLIHISEPTRRS